MYPLPCHPNNPQDSAFRRINSPPESLEGAFFVLASSSPRRRDLLGKIVNNFTVLEPRGVDEQGVKGAASEIASRLAVLKAESVVGELSRVGFPPRRTFVIGSDTVVAAEAGSREAVLGKPTDANDARRMLLLLAGRAHCVWTGVAIASPGLPTLVAVERTEVRFRKLSLGEIEDYVSSGDWDGKAGAYGIQSQGSGLVAAIRGCYYNVVGLPLRLTSRLLSAAGVKAHECDCLQHPLQDKLTAPCLPRPCELA